MRSSLKTLSLCLLISIFMFVGSSHFTFAQVVGGDGNNDGKIDGIDYVIWLNNFGITTSSGATKGDYNIDTKVDGIDYVLWLNNFGQVLATSTPTPTTPPTIPPTNSGEWSQFGGNPQRTNSTSQSIAAPWRLKWQWNGAGSDGKKSSSHVTLAEMSQPTSGDGKIYMMSKSTVYALSATNGSIVWSKSGIGTLGGSPAYDAGYVYIPSTSGLQKLSSATGQSSGVVSGSFQEAVAIANGRIFAVSTQGVLSAINPTTMTSVWQYSAGSAAATMPAYSPSSNTVVFVTQDLQVHAVNVGTGALRWKRKPTPRSYQAGIPGTGGAQVDSGWPVIAEQHGIVFVRYRVDWNTIWTWNPFPTTNAAIRANLVSKPEEQSLYALKLSDGSTAFIPTVGSGGQADGGDMSIGPKPVVSIIDGKEVVYISFRNGLTCQSAGWCDAREDATMGEMVLDNSTVSGYEAGDLRFVKFEDIQTDEMMNITVAGDTIFHSHWLVNAAAKITNRSSGIGATFTNPIQTTSMPYVIWRQCNGSNVCGYPGCTGNTTCGNSCALSTGRYCAQGLYSYGDARSFPAGFYEYLNDFPYEQVSTGGYYTQQAFTVLSNNLLMVKTVDGGLLVFESGNPTAQIPSSQGFVAGITSTSSDQPIHDIEVSQALSYLDFKVRVKGIIRSVKNNRPKGIYLGFNKPHDGALLIRIFEKDLSKFDLPTLLSLEGKRVSVTGTVSLYWPQGKDPEIVLTEPSQLHVE